MRCRMMVAFIAPAALTLAGVGLQSALASAIPAGEAWTEDTSGYPDANGVQWAWGKFGSGNPSITRNTSDMTTGDVSIDYANYAPIDGANNDQFGPAVVFGGGHADRRPDLTGFEGGTVSWDFKYNNGAGTSDYMFSQIYIYDGSNTSHYIAYENSIAPNLTPNAWHHVQVTLPASWTSGSNPAQIYAIRFQLIFKPDSTTQSFQFDNLQLTPVPEPAGVGLLLLGGMILPVARRRQRA